MGIVDVSGGNGDNLTMIKGDGGSGGRISLYYKENTFIG